RGRGGEEVGDAETAAFLLAGEGEAEEFFWLRDGACGGRARAPVAPLAWVVDYYVVAVALGWKISVDYFWLEPACRYHVLFQLLFDRTVLLFYQPRVVFLRRRLQLPL